MTACLSNKILSAIHWRSFGPNDEENIISSYNLQSSYKSWSLASRPGNTHIDSTRFAMMERRKQSKIFTDSWAYTEERKPIEPARWSVTCWSGQPEEHQYPITVRKLLLFTFERWEQGRAWNQTSCIKVYTTSSACGEDGGWGGFDKPNDFSRRSPL